MLTKKEIRLAANRANKYPKGNGRNWIVDDERNVAEIYPLLNKKKSLLKKG